MIPRNFILIPTFFIGVYLLASFSELQYVEAAWYHGMPKEKKAGEEDANVASVVKWSQEVLVDKNMQADFATWAKENSKLIPDSKKDYPFAVMQFLYSRTKGK